MLYAKIMFPMLAAMLVLYYVMLILEIVEIYIFKKRNIESKDFIPFRRWIK